MHTKKKNWCTLYVVAGVVCGEKKTQKKKKRERKNVKDAVTGGQWQQSNPQPLHAKLLRMDSSEGMERNTKDFHLVYVRKRRKDTSSGKGVPDLNIFLPDLNESIFLHLEPNSSTPKIDGPHEIGDDGRDFACELCKGRELVRCGACPRVYHLECLDLKSAPGKEWRCPNCYIDDELSMPIKYLKTSDSKKYKSKKAKDGSRYLLKSKEQSTCAITDNQV